MILHAALASLLRPVVAARGEITEAEMAAEVRRLLPAVSGSGRIDDLLDEMLRDRDTPLFLVGDRVVDVAATVATLALTHRLTAEERAIHTVHLSPDLGAVAAVAAVDGGLHLPDGRALWCRTDRRRGAGRAGATRLEMRLEGPPGWLDAYDPGTLVAFGTAEGVLTLAPVAAADLAPVPQDAAEKLERLFRLANDGDGTPVLDEELQLLAALEYPAWFATPTVPFGELTRSAGFECDGHLVGRPGTWEAHRRTGEVIASLLRNQHLAQNGLDVLMAGLKAFDAWRADPASTEPGRVEARVRREWAAAAALLEEVRRRDPGAQVLRDFGAALGGPVGAWMTSRASAVEGESLEAERQALDLVAADPSFGPAVAEAAWYASDRGDARQAVNLLHRVRLPHDDELEAMRARAAAQADTPGRNEPCPCGSGRKYKQCHLGRPQLADDDRASWLLDKARAYIEMVAGPEVVAEALDGFDAPDIGDLLAMDLLLFDEGWLARFLAARRALLPDPEPAWLEAWMGGHRASVFRSAGTTAAGDAVLVDLADGSRYHVRTSAGPLRTADRLAWCRLLPQGGGWSTSGLVRPVRLTERDSVLAGWAAGATREDRRAALFPAPRPPRVTNTSGDDMVLISTVVDAGPAGALAATLDEHLERRGDELAWETVEETNGMERAVTAGFTQTDPGGTTVVIDTNSPARRDRALARLRELVPGARVVSEERTLPARARALRWAQEQAEALRRAAGADGDGFGEFDDDDGSFGELEDDDDDGDGDGFGEFDDDDEDDGDEDDDDQDDDDEALLAEFMASVDERWVDQAIPVLGGLTPRQAAADDEARADLRTLLAEIEERDPDTVARWRRVLDLPAAPAPSGHHAEPAATQAARPAT